MPAYADTPADLEKELRTLRITCDPIEDEPLTTVSRADRDVMEDMIEEAKEGTHRSIREFRRLAKKYPDNPCFKNLLSVALTMAGKSKEAQEMHDRIYREHPDYLFGKLNHVARYLEKGADAQRIPGVLGESLRLCEAAPRDIHHISEVKSFYTTVAYYHLRSDRGELAQTILRFLQDRVDSWDRGLQQLAGEVGLWNFERIQNMGKEEESRAIRVKVPCHPERFPDPNRPTFHHPEVEALYYCDFDLPEIEIKTILALPRNTLIDDLEKVLRDSLTRGILFEEGRIGESGEKKTFPLHAIMFLGELGAIESLP